MKETIKNINKLLKNDFFRSIDAFVFIIMSHGCEKRIYGVDGQILCIQEDILNKFSEEEISSLADKPKIFIFQACRGEKYDQGYPMVKSDAINTSEPVFRFIPHSSAYLVLYPCIPG